MEITRDEMIAELEASRERFDLEMLFCAYSDCFKSEYGFRPRGEMPSEAEMLEYLEGYEQRLPVLAAQWAEESAYYDQLEVDYAAERLAYEAAKIEAVEEAKEFYYLAIEQAATQKGRAYIYGG